VLGEKGGAMREILKIKEKGGLGEKGGAMREI
jgi:hypothetical protein